MPGDDTLPLFAAQLPHLAWLTSGDRVPVPNSSEARWALDADGGLWVRKRQEDTGYQELLAEALGWQLGRHLGAPIPDGATYGRGPELSWLSRAVPNVLPWRREAATNVENLGELGRVLTLDLLLLNHDRHAGNILLEFDGNRRARAWAIDAGAALVGHVDEFAEQVSALPSTDNVARGLPVSAMETGAMAAARAAAKINERLLRRFVDESCGLVGEQPSAELLYESLRARCRLATELLPSYLDAVGAAL